jgi:hypothetical protein
MKNSQARWDRETLRVELEGRIYEGVRFASRARPLRQEVQYLTLRRADPASYDATDGAFMRDMARDLLRGLVREFERSDPGRWARQGSNLRPPACKAGALAD